MKDVKPAGTPQHCWNGWLKVRDSGRYKTLGDYIEDKHPMLDSFGNDAGWK